LTTIDWRKTNRPRRSPIINTAIRIILSLPLSNQNGCSILRIIAGGKLVSTPPIRHDLDLFVVRRSLSGVCLPACHRGLFRQWEDRTWILVLSYGDHRQTIRGDASNLQTAMQSLINYQSDHRST
jgi:hypothetical protein